MKISIQRTILIKAKRSKVYETLIDLENWKIWSPWLSLDIDPELKIHQSGKEMEWKGKIIGIGRIAIVKKIPQSKIEAVMKFIDPAWPDLRFLFLLKSTRSMVEITWKIILHLPFFLFSRKERMYTMISMDCDRGLQMLKSFLECGSMEFSVDEPFLQKIPYIHYVGTRFTHCPLEALSEAESSVDFDRIAADVQRHGKIHQKVGIYHAVNSENNTLDFTCGFIVSSDAVDALKSSYHEWGRIGGGTAVTCTYRGDNRFLSNGWNRALNFARYNRKKTRREILGYEIKSKDPGTVTKLSQCITEIIIPLR